MDTIARIPELSMPGSPAVAPGVEPRRRRSAFPVRSVATLALIAAVAWILANWHEHERLVRQRRPVRLAQEPAASVRESIAP